MTNRYDQLLFHPSWPQPEKSWDLVDVKAPKAEVAEDSGAGRPRDPAKHAAIINAALRIFLDNGFNAALIEHQSRSRIVLAIRSRLPCGATAIKRRTSQSIAAIMAVAEAHQANDLHDGQQPW